MIRNGGLKVRLVHEPFPQPLGSRNMRAVWKRQLRWARLRSRLLPALFLPEIFTGAALPGAAMVALAVMGFVSRSRPSYISRPGTVAKFC